MLMLDAEVDFKAKSTQYNVHVVHNRDRIGLFHETDIKKENY